MISDCVLIRASDFADETPTSPVSHYYLIPLFSIHSVFPFMHGHSANDMGAEDPEHPTNSPATAVVHIPSKRGLTQLPLPNTICSHNNARSGTSFTIRVTIATLILLWTLLNINFLTSPFKHTHPIGSVDDPSAAGYLRGVSTKGMKWALPAPNHQLQGTYHDGEGTEIREKGIKTSLIPPNLAEKIFLDIPSNDSVAA